MMFLNIKSLYFSVIFIFSLFSDNFTLINAQQDIDGNCGGSVKCSVGLPCTVDPTGLPSDEVRICTESAICNTISSVCECSDGFLATPYGFCLATLGAPCLRSPCNEEAVLVCDEVTNSCKCPHADNHFSEAQKSCVGGEGAVCSGIVPCTENAYCNFMFDWKCRCSGGYLEDADGRCKASLGTKCFTQVDKEGGALIDNTQDCNSQLGLACVKGVCQCAEGRTLEEGKCKLIQDKSTSNALLIQALPIIFINLLLVNFVFDS